MIYEAVSECDGICRHLIFCATTARYLLVSFVVFNLSCSFFLLCGCLSLFKQAAPIVHFSLLLRARYIEIHSSLVILHLFIFLSFFFFFFSRPSIQSFISFKIDSRVSVRRQRLLVSIFLYSISMGLHSNCLFLTAYMKYFIVIIHSQILSILFSDYLLLSIFFDLTTDYLLLSIFDLT